MTRFKDALADVAEQAPPLGDVADRALAQCRRRRVTSVAACVVALTITVPVGLELVDLAPPGKTKIAPIEIPTSSPRPSETDPARSGVIKPDIDLDSLPQGDPPAITWYADGSIHDGDRETPIGEVGQRTTVNFQPVAGGYLVMTSRPGTGVVEARLIGDDGGTRAELPIDTFPVVSTDGQTITFAQTAADGGNTTLVAIDADTGSELSRTSVKGSPGAHPLGFVGDLVVFAFSETQQNRWWNLDTRDIGPLVDNPVTAATDGSHRTIQAFDPTSPHDLDFQNACYKVVDMSDGSDRGAKVWGTCEISLYLFTADGRYVVGHDYSDPNTVATVLLDAETGKAILDLSLGGRVENLAIEPTGDVIMESTQGDQKAIVRCALRGECELASEVVHAPDGFTRVVGLPDPLPGR